MIDYLAHLATLAAVEATIVGIPAESPLAAAAVLTSAAADAEPGCAALGAAVDHLLEHAECTDRELSQLEQAAATYRQGLDLAAAVRSVRDDVQAAVLSPDAPDALDRYNNAAAALQQLLAAFGGLAAQAESLAEELDVPTYLHPHGQSTDSPVATWAWRDVVMGRRTDAFCAALLHRVAENPQRQAFAFGALCSYAGNVVASGYQNAVVGGPRRSHPMRHRMAKYAIGNWLRINGLAPSLSDLRSRLDFPGNPSGVLPPAVKTMLEEALDEVYQPGGPASVPDLDHGYRNLMRHLDLLLTFERPALPAPLPLDLAIRAVGSPAGPSAGPVSTKDVPPGDGPSGSTGTSIAIYSNDSAAEKRKKICTIIAWILFAVVMLVFGSSSGGGTPPPEGTSDSKVSPLTTPAALKALATSDSAVEIVQRLHELDLAVYAALTESLGYLKAAGLIYPDELDVGEPLFSQFTKLPAGSGISGYPRLPAAADSYTNPPPAVIELPATAPTDAFPGTSPAGLFDPTPSGATGVCAFGLALWLAHTDPQTPQAQRINHNLDADRAFRASCWAVALGTSIADSPVVSQLLDYSTI